MEFGDVSKNSDETHLFQRQWRKRLDASLDHKLSQQTTHYWVRVSVPKKTVGVSHQFSYVSSFATIFNLPGPEKHELKTLSKLKCFGYLIYGITTLGVLPLRASLPPPKATSIPCEASWSPRLSARTVEQKNHEPTVFDTALSHPWERF